MVTILLANGFEVAEALVTLDLLHRLLRGLFRRQFVFDHYAFDVLHHHDGIINQQADGQHHAKHR